MWFVLFAKCGAMKLHHSARKLALLLYRTRVVSQSWTWYFDKINHRTGWSSVDLLIWLYIRIINYALFCYYTFLLSFSYHDLNCFVCYSQFVPINVFLLCAGFSQLIDFYRIFPMCFLWWFRLACVIMYRYGLYRRCTGNKIRYMMMSESDNSPLYLSLNILIYL